MENNFGLSDFAVSFSVNVDTRNLDQVQSKLTDIGKTYSKMKHDFEANPTEFSSGYIAQCDDVIRKVSEMSDRVEKFHKVVESGKISQGQESEAFTRLGNDYNHFAAQASLLGNNQSGFSLQLAHQMMASLPNDLAKELKKMQPQIASRLQTAMNSVGRTSAITSNSVRGIATQFASLGTTQQMIRSLQDKFPTFTQQQFADYVRLNMPQLMDLYKTNEYNVARYQQQLRNGIRYSIYENKPEKVLSPRMAEAYINKGFSPRKYDTNSTQGQQQLSGDALNRLRALFENNGVAASAGVKSGVLSYTGNGKLQMKNSVSRNDTENLLGELYHQAMTRGAGFADTKIKNVYDAKQAATLAKRLQRGNPGKVVVAGKELEDIIADTNNVNWVSGQQSAGYSPINAARRPLERYAVKSYKLFDPAGNYYEDQQTHRFTPHRSQMNESYFTDVAGLSGRDYEASDKFLRLNVGRRPNGASMYPQDGKIFTDDERSMLRSIFTKVKRDDGTMEFQGYTDEKDGKKYLPITVHGSGEDTTIIMGEASMMRNVQKQQQEIMQKLYPGFKGNVWQLDDDRNFDGDITSMNKHIEAINKGFTPSRQLYNNLQNASVVVIDDKKNLDGSGFASAQLIPGAIQSRVAISGKGTLVPFNYATWGEMKAATGEAGDANGDYWVPSPAIDKNGNHIMVKATGANIVIDKSQFKDWDAIVGNAQTPEEMNERVKQYMLRPFAFRAATEFENDRTNVNSLGSQATTFLRPSSDTQRKIENDQFAYMHKLFSDLSDPARARDMVFGDRYADNLSDAIWGNLSLITSDEAQERIDLFKRSKIGELLSGQYFSTDMNDGTGRQNITHKRLLLSPIVSEALRNTTQDSPVNQGILSRARGILTDYYGDGFLEKYNITDEKLANMLLLKPVYDENNLSPEELAKLSPEQQKQHVTLSTMLDFDSAPTPSQVKKGQLYNVIGAIRSPSAYGTMVAGRNYAGFLRPVFEQMGLNIDSLQLNKHDMDVLNDADMDADTAAILQGIYANAVIDTLRDKQVNSVNTGREPKAFTAAAGTVAGGLDNSDSWINYIERSIETPLKMGSFSNAGSSLMQRNLNAATRWTADLMRVAYGGASTYYKTPVTFPEEINGAAIDVNKYGRENQKLANHLEGIFDVYGDMSTSDNGERIFRTNAGDIMRPEDVFRFQKDDLGHEVLLNKKALESWKIDDTNLPSVYMPSMVGAIRTAQRVKDEFGIDTSMADALKAAFTDEIHGIAFPALGPSVSDPSKSAVRAATKRHREMIADTFAGNGLLISNQTRDQLLHMLDDADQEIRNDFAMLPKNARGQAMIQGRKTGMSLGAYVGKREKQSGITALRNAIEVGGIGFTEDNIREALGQDAGNLLIKELKGKEDIPITIGQNVSGVITAVNEETAKQIVKAQADSAKAAQSAGEKDSEIKAQIQEAQQTAIDGATTISEEAFAARVKQINANRKRQTTIALKQGKEAPTWDLTVEEQARNDFANGYTPKQKTSRKHQSNEIKPYVPDDANQKATQSRFGPGAQPESKHQTYATRRSNIAEKYGRNGFGPNAAAPYTYDPNANQLHPGATISPDDPRYEQIAERNSSYVPGQHPIAGSENKGNQRQQIERQTPTAPLTIGEELTLANFNIKQLDELESRMASMSRRINTRTQGPEAPKIFEGISYFNDLESFLKQFEDMESVIKSQPGLPEQVRNSYLTKLEGLKDGTFSQRGNFVLSDIGANLSYIDKSLGVNKTDRQVQALNNFDDFISKIVTTTEKFEDSINAHPSKDPNVMEREQGILSWAQDQATQAKNKRSEYIAKQQAYNDQYYYRENASLYKQLYGGNVPIAEQAQYGALAMGESIDNKLFTLNERYEKGLVSDNVYALRSRQYQQYRDRVNSGEYEQYLKDMGFMQQDRSVNQLVNSERRLGRQAGSMYGNTMLQRMMNMKENEYYQRQDLAYSLDAQKRNLKGQLDQMAANGDTKSANYAKTAAELDKVTAAAARNKAAMDGLTGPLSAVNATFTTLGVTLNRLGTQFARQMFQKMWKEAKQFVQEFDKSMTEIQMITLKSDEEMESVKSNTISKAIDLKTSVSNVASTEAALYRQGLSESEVSERTDQIIKFAAVTGVKVEDAMKGATVAMQSGLVSTIQEATDGMVALGDAAATTAAEISKGMQKSAAGAKVAGVSYNELLSLITIGTSKTQLGGAQVGTALNTLFARMGKVTADGYYSDVNGQSLTLNDAEKALNIMGISLRDSNGGFRSRYDVLYDVASKWQGASDTQKSVVTNALAGTRATNIFQTLMEGMSEDGGEELKKYMETLENADGITDKKYDVYAKSLAASLDTLKSSFDGVVASFANSTAFTGIINGLSSLLQSLAAVTNQSGNFVVAISAITGVIAGLAAMIGAGLVPGLRLIAPLVGLLAGGVATSSIAALGASASSNSIQAQQKQQETPQYEVLSDKKVSNLQSQIDEVNRLGEAFERGQDVSDALSSALDSLRSSFADLGIDIGNAAGEMDKYAQSTANATKQLNNLSIVKAKQRITQSQEAQDGKNVGLQAQEYVKEHVESDGEGGVVYSAKPLNTKEIQLGKPVDTLTGSYQTYVPVGSMDSQPQTLQTFKETHSEYVSDEEAVSHLMERYDYQVVDNADLGYMYEHGGLIFGKRKYSGSDKSILNSAGYQVDPDGNVYTLNNQGGEHRTIRQVSPSEYEPIFEDNIEKANADVILRGETEQEINREKFVNAWQAGVLVPPGYKVDFGDASDYYESYKNRNNADYEYPFRVFEETVRYDKAWQKEEADQLDVNDIIDIDNQLYSAIEPFLDGERSLAQAFVAAKQAGALNDYWFAKDVDKTPSVEELATQNLVKFTNEDPFRVFDAIFNEKSKYSIVDKNNSDVSQKMKQWLEDSSSVIPWEKYGYKDYDDFKTNYSSGDANGILSLMQNGIPVIDSNGNVEMQSSLGDPQEVKNAYLDYIVQQLPTLPELDKTGLSKKAIVQALLNKQNVVNENGEVVGNPYEFAGGVVSSESFMNQIVWPWLRDYIDAYYNGTSDSMIKDLQNDMNDEYEIAHINNAIVGLDDNGNPVYGKHSFFNQQEIDDWLKQYPNDRMRIMTGTGTSEQTMYDPISGTIRAQAQYNRSSNPDRTTAAINFFNDYIKDQTGQNFQNELNKAGTDAEQLRSNFSAFTATDSFLAAAADSFLNNQNQWGNWEYDEDKWNFFKDVYQNKAFGTDKTTDYGASLIKYLGLDTSSGSSLTSSLDDIYGMEDGDDKSFKIEVLKQLANVYPELTSVINDYNDASLTTEERTKNVEEATNKLAQAMGLKAVQEANKYKNNLSDIESAYKSVASGGKTATTAITNLAQQWQKLGDKRYSLNQFASGSKDKDILSEVAGLTGFGAQNLKKMTDDQVKSLVKAYEQSLSEQQDELLDVFNSGALAALSDELSSVLNQDVLQTFYKDIDLGNIPISGTIDASALIAGANNANLAVYAEIMRLAGLQLSIVKTANGYKLQASKGSGYGGGLSSGGSGGGGSGGKKQSDADKLLKQLKHEQEERDHLLKMVQYDETKYQNAGQLGNYGKMLEAQIEIEREYLPLLEQHIQKLRSQMNATERGTDDWFDLRDALLDAEEKMAELNNTIDENVKKLKENQQAILKLKSDLQETVLEEIQNRIQKDRDMLDGRVQMEETILNAIKNRYTSEWELLQKDIQKKKDALQEELALIDERLQKRKKAEDSAKKYEQLTEYKNQLASIEMDPTRTKDALKLRKQIADLESDIGWDISDSQAEAEKNSIEDQIKAYEEYESEYQEYLDKFLEDANNFSAEVNEVLGMSHEDMIDWLKQNDKDYINSLEDAQKQLLENWEDTFKKMQGIVDTYWSQINEIIKGKESFLDYMKQSDTYKNASDEQKAQMEYEWQQMWDNWAAAQDTSAEFTHSDASITNVTYVGKGSGESNSGGGGYTKPKEYSYTYNGKEYKGFNSAEQAQKNLDYRVSQDKSKALKQNDNYVKNDPVLSKNSAAQKAQTDGINKTYNQKKSDAEKTIKAYASGGLVDFTGPAWVDGSFSKPEAFLSAEDTALMRSMLDAAKMISIPNMMSIIPESAYATNSTSSSVGDVYVKIESAKFDSDADYEYIAQRVGDVISKELSKQGMSTAAYSF